MFRNCYLLATTLFLFTTSLQAQDAALDPAFNPADIGFNNGNGPGIHVGAMALQPDGKLLIVGSFTNYNGTARGHVARINTDGTLDNSFFAGTGADAEVLDLVLQPDGKIIIVGEFSAVHGTPCGRIARLNTDGSLDNTFNPGTGADNPIWEVARQSDGKLVIYGPFFTVNGTSKMRLARLNTNGSLDAAFPAATPALNGTVWDLTVLADNDIMIGGDFTTYDGQTRNRIARLNANGSLDLTFDAGAGPNNSVNAIAQQPDGQLLIAGDFTSYAGTTRWRVARIDGTGALDVSYATTLSVPGTVYCIAQLPDGKLVVGGNFLITSGVVAHRIMRLTSTGATDATFVFEPAVATNEINALAIQGDGRVIIASMVHGMTTGLTRLMADGALDFTYNPGTGAANYVYAVAHQSDGKAIIGGSFVRYNGVKCKRIVRVNMDGSIDGTFNTGTGFNNEVLCVAVQPDGKVLVGGDFTNYNGTARSAFVRLNTDGTLDASFVSNMNSSPRAVHAIRVMPDGRIVVAGNFSQAGGMPRARVARFLSDGTLDAAFNPGTGPNLRVHGLAIQPDGKVLIGGEFTTVAGNPSPRLARLNDDGTFDATFAVGTGADEVVSAIHVLADGRIVLGGGFDNYNGVGYRGLARLTSTGALDPTFTNPGPFNNIITCISEQPDGQLLISGNFGNINGVTIRHIARLNPNGTIDTTFAPTPGANATVHGHSLRFDGRILIGGSFTAYNGTGRNNVALIHGTARIRNKVLLQGPYNGVMMHDSLRRQGVLPRFEPYTAMGYNEPTFIGGDSIHSSVLDITGVNAIVDWVLMEMRPVATPGTVTAVRAVLLQRDGDVVDLDGVSPVGFPGLADGDYCVAVKPRTHLPVMLSPNTPFSFGNGVSTVDFTLVGAELVDDDAMNNVGGVMVLAMGDVTFNEIVQYTGTNNDRDPILVRIGGSTPTVTLAGYYREDVNMDGIVKYTGVNNDRDIVLVSIGGSTPTAVRDATLP